jgi:ATP-dependent Lhr-like helicase
MLPVPFELAVQTGKMRGEIEDALKETGSAEAAAESLAKKLSTDKAALLDAVKEVEEHVKQGVPVPTDRLILAEAFDKYLIVHACFGEVVNYTLGSIFDSILSDREFIVGWWNDGYHVLVEVPRAVGPQDMDRLSKTLFGLSDEETEKAFEDCMEAKFPFSYKMKFVAERFGALPRGKAMGPERQGQLPARFRDTPVYDETLREAMLEKVDVGKVKEIMRDVREGTIRVSSVYRSETPTPLAFHILSKYSDVSELMAPERLLLSNIDKMKKTIEARTARLLCMNCGEWMGEERVKSLPEHPKCEKCGSGLLALLYPGQDADRLQTLLKKRREAKEVSRDELKELTNVRRTADLVLSYGKNAIVALEVKGVGPETAFRILGRMHPTEEEFFMDLLKAKIQYLRTREYWEDKEQRAKT